MRENANKSIPFGQIRLFPLVKNIQLALLALFLFLAPGETKAQNFEGTEFRIAFLKNLNVNLNGPPTFDFSIHAIENVQVTIAYGQPGDAYFDQQAINLTAGQVGVISFPGQFLNQEELHVVQTRSFRVTSTGTIRLYAYHHRMLFSDVTAVLPVTALGSEYIVATHQNPGSNVPSLFNIIGHEDNTVVTVIPSVNTPLGAANVPFQVTLDAGEVISIGSNGNLTGSRVFTESGTAFAAYAGHQQVSYPADCNADNHIFEQLMPVNTWGQYHPLVPTLDSGGDLAIIVALEDNTDITIGCEVLPTLGAGQSTTFFLGDGPQIMISSGPVQVMMLTVSCACNDMNTGDPNLRVVLPLDRGNTEVKFRSGLDFTLLGPLPGTIVVEIHLVMPTAETANLTVNGASIDQWELFDVFPEFSVAKVPLANVAVLTTIESSTPFWGEFVAMRVFDALSMSLGSNTEMVVPPLEVVFVDLGGDQALCPGQSLVLDPGVTTTGVWQDGSNEPTFEVSQAGLYYFVSDLPCGADTVEVNISQAELSLIDSAAVCAGESVTLEATALPDYTYLWNTGEEGPSLTVAAIGSYTLTATNPDGCDTSATATVSLLLPPVAEIIGEDSFCEGDTIVLFAQGEGDYLWSTGFEGPELLVFEAGNYSLTVTADNGCTDEAGTFVSRLTQPFLLVDSASACPGEEVTVDATSPNAVLQWVTPEVENPAELGPGLYLVSISNECGVELIPIEVEEEDCDCASKIPNIFSPNGDGRNDAFIPDMECEPVGFQLTVFNRWGKEVYSGSDHVRGWRGEEPDGNPASAGLYYYVLSYINPLRQEVAKLNYTGWVTLVR